MILHWCSDITKVIQQEENLVALIRLKLRGAQVRPIGRGWDCNRAVNLIARVA